MKVKPKKHLGQHFLKDQEVSKNMAKAVHESGVKRVLEVGPGTGALTKELLAYDALDVKVIEIDRESIAYLAINYPSLEVITEDFLNVDLRKIMGDEPFAVVGNFPYNISSQIIFKVLDNMDIVSMTLGMFQKEVAQRFVADPGSKIYGITSVLTQAFYSGKYLFSVGSEAFDPPPKVQSGVISLTRNNVQELDCDMKRFKQIVKMAFNQRRKTLRNSLKSMWQDAGLIIDPDNVVYKKRPEQLSVDDFVKLTQQLSV